VNPERWQTIKHLLATAMELPPAQRPDYLDKSCAGDASLRKELEGLLEEEQQINPQFLDESHLAAVVTSVIPEEIEKNAWINRRIGPYRIVALIGAGGMGEVYRATRDDDQYRKDVALKVVRAGQNSSVVISRFRNERQILATLDHPCIARLLDGGTTDDGMPYFVMELIDGQPITEYCDRQKISITGRLKLFSQVCAAVHHAHQHLVIHRDIKPGNILVTAEGVPKLLDFGIAKILDFDSVSGAPEATLTAFRILTPRYASPEQIKGEAMTTASDVYSLGVVLYELLTGQSPYRLSSRTSQEIAQAACNSQPQKPSLAVGKSKVQDDSTSTSQNSDALSALRSSSPEKLHKRLDGDLDNIVLMALRKEPSRRYASVEQFSADIQRHLEHTPVVARKDTLWYRTSKFVSRHRTGVLASAAAVLALLTGFGIALHEARIARIQRARAERRFNDVRQIANSLMFEAHDSIKDLPGTTPARKVLVSGALKYLDSLSQEATGDVSLQRELAASYDRVGDLLGYNGAANLGDLRGALQSYDKALAIRESAAAANPGDAQINGELLSDYFRLSFVLQDAGDYTTALDHLRKALPLAQKLAAAHADPRSQDTLAGVYWLTGHILAANGNDSEAAENFRQAKQIREPMASAAGGNPILRTHLAADYIGLGKTLPSVGDIPGALESSTKGIQILENLSEVDPANATIREYLGEAYSISSPLLQKEGDLDRALTNSRKALRIFGELASADPTNSLARVNLGLAESGVAKIFIQQNKIDEAMSHLRQAIAVFESIKGESRYEIEGQGDAYSTLAAIYVSFADHDQSARKKTEHLHEARGWYQKSLGALRQGLIITPSDTMMRTKSELIAQELAKCDDALGKLQQSN
jgi:non-specific serine/threonine protein kinase/serine/threonine-protein kinase